ncbi:MAG: diaminopimelate decarboxylase [Deltaproteobacteria bacterium]|nr:MAG: diaminopimelate decarboxylase [Deltaproteobacteria bacterium]
MPNATEPSPLRDEIAGIPVARLAREFGTPTFVYDAARIVQRIRDLAAFDVVRYAQKANSNLAILDLCRRHGTRVDCVSAGEISRALAAGFQAQGAPPPIAYTADIFDRESLDLVVERGIYVNCGSPDMIDQYGERAGRRDIALRINPGFGHGHSQKTNTGGEQSKHGIWHEQVPACLERARRLDLHVSGLHMHIGSGTDLAHLSKVCGAMEDAVRRVGTGITSISAGGGLPVPSRAGEPAIDLDAYFELWNQSRQRIEAELGHAVSLEIEPGRYLVAESGYLVTEIRAVKQMGRNTFYIVDAGFNNLPRPILYGAYHGMSIAPAAGASRERALREVVVGGPLCESGDIFTQEEGGFVLTRTLPDAGVGDYLVIEQAGAYGFAMSSNYNSKPHAAELLIEDGRVHLVRRRQSVEDLIRGESIPPRG